MQRCLQLARLAAGHVAPNPMVGAVLVYNNRIIGEGYHQQYGKPHAEVNCIASVTTQDAALIEKSILYVSLEPCAHFGKTPPCADLIIAKKIPHVVVGCRDPFVQVDGKGMEKLLNAGVKVDVGVLEKEAIDLNKRFFTFHQKHRPYVILKWAQTADGYIGTTSGERLLISNWYSHQLVHRWRSEEAAIMVGTRTAFMDNPALTTRLWPGNSPLRLVVDMDLKLPASLQLFDGAAPTLVFNRHRHSIENFSDKAFIRNKETAFYQVNTGVSLVVQMLDALHHLNIQSVIVEGGACLLQSFINEQIWDEARVITNTRLFAAATVKAPELRNAVLWAEDCFEQDKIGYYGNLNG